MNDEMFEGKYDLHLVEFEELRNIIAEFLSFFSWLF